MSLFNPRNTDGKQNGDELKCVRSHRKKITNSHLTFRKVVPGYAF